MKNSIKNLFAAALVMVTLSGATLAAKASENNAGYTVLNQVKNISKIIVSGNVKLILVQDDKEGVEVYDAYYRKNALVQQQGSELRISSFDKTTLMVVAHVNNISSIEASNTATVATAGNFNVLSLNVVLNDKATADIKANTISLSTTVNDAASLKLEGSTESHIAVVGAESKMKMNEFTAQETNIKVSAKPVLASNNKSRYDDLKIDLLEKLF
ncbi:hypothetical protein DU508_05845 [Pedobacter chinensis]|uniref:Putative auto-transporter adhesin head GIN domain-containing protein n=1 Tax=Pedobacter chinensis TaxID=2282421 RepID=A0A369PZV6_9SPHI|nr:DUF2807 domain-containing protein [Pedobacter chinensis]RDC56725.1 hypothetical protein DU508_05845 [Pedobacter chinensis]